MLNTETTPTEFQPLPLRHPRVFPELVILQRWHALLQAENLSRIVE
jgi:hypothetical protein